MTSSYRLSMMMMMMRRTNRVAHLCSSSSTTSSITWKSQFHSFIPSMLSYPINGANYNHNPTGCRGASRRRYCISTIHTNTDNSSHAKSNKNNEVVQMINTDGNSNSNSSSNTHVYLRNESSTTSTSRTTADMKITTTANNSSFVTNKLASNSNRSSSTDATHATSTGDNTSATAATAASPTDDPHIRGVQPTARHKQKEEEEVIIKAAVGADPHLPAIDKQVVVVDEQMVWNVLSTYNSDNRATLSAEDAVEACMQAWRGQIKLSIRQLCTVIEVCSNHRAQHKDLYHVAYWSYQQLRKESRTLSIETYENILSLCTANKELEDASTVLNHFEENGYTYTSSVLQSMVRLLSGENSVTPEVGR